MGEHAITVTRTVFGRTWFDCTCGIARVFPSKRAANAAAIIHARESGLEIPEAS